MIRSSNLLSLALLATLAAPPALAQTAPPGQPAAQGEPAANPAAAAPAQGATPAQNEGQPPRVEAISKAPPAPTPPKPVVNKWTATLYGFAELDAIYDTVQGLGEVPGNPVLAHDGTYGRYHDRTQLSIRNSRLGFRFSAPEYNGMKPSGMIETDFYGNTPNAAGGGSESALFNNAGLRVRHAILRLETPIVDVLAGQYWELFGWQPYFHPNTVEVQGVPGQVYSRTAQLRLSKTLRSDAVTLELAVAALRPPQRDAGTPDGQAGARLAFNGWKGVRTAGSTGTSLDPAGLGVSGIYRRFQLQTPATGGGTADPHASSTAEGYGVSVDGFIPLIPTKSIDDRSNALTATGSFAKGQGIQDLYSGFTNGGTSTTTLAGSNGIDPGLVVFEGTKLTPIRISSFIVGAQYYLPVAKGSVWLAGNYSQVLAYNSELLAGAPRGAFKRSRWYDGCLFWDATPAVRFGLEYARFEQKLVDDTTTRNDRYQLSTFFLF